MKTYSRLKKSTYLSSEPPAKRRRILADDYNHGIDKALTSDALSTAPSSPPRDSSTTALPSSTPPSSPPPAETATPTSPLPLPKRRPTFSFFARRPTAAAAKPSYPQPLEQPQCNANTNGPNPKATEEEKEPKTRRPPAQQQQKRLTQLQLDLGSSPVQRTCKTCGMAYVPANAEDAALHKAFHAMNVGGVEVGRAFVKNSSGVVWEKGVDGDVVVAVGRRDGVAARTRVGRVLEVVEKELGAVVIPEDELWGQVVCGEEEKREKGQGKSGERRAQVEEKEPKPQQSAAVAKGKKTRREETVLRADRFKAYLYVRGSKCIGLCLAERITEAYRVVAPPQDPAVSPKITTTVPADAKPPPKEDQPTPNTSAEPSPPPPTPQPQLSRQPPSSTTTPTLTTSPTPHPATLGISRIWVSSSHRRHGVATALLDAATRDFCHAHYYDGDERCGGRAAERDRMRRVKERVAFSQPTDGGARLARTWFGRGVGEGGWGVYW